MAKKLYWPRESFHTELADGTGLTLPKHDPECIVEEGHELLTGGRMVMFEEVKPAFPAPPPAPKKAKEESTRVVDEPKSSSARSK